MTDEDYNEQELDRFEARFFGTLPEADASAFDAQLERDEAMKGRYELFVLSVRGIRSGSAVPQGSEAETLREKIEAGRAATASAALRRTMRAVDDELDAQFRTMRSFMRPWMGWAAAAAVLISIIGAWWLTKGETPQQIADEFAIAEPGLPVLMGAEPGRMDVIMNAYKRNDFAVAGSLIDAVLAMDPENDTLNYFAGVVAMRTGNCDDAEVRWRSVHDSSEFASRALYNEAICRLRKSDVMGASTFLQRVIATKDTQLSAKAGDLLARLEYR